MSVSGRCASCPRICRSGLDSGDDKEKERDQNRPNPTRIPRPPHRKPGRRASHRGIRFSDSEWQEVTAAAEFIRKRIMDVARGHADAGADAIPASLAPLIGRTFRCTYMLVARKRDELAREGHGEEMEKLAKDAQELQDQL